MRTQRTFANGRCAILLLLSAMLPVAQAQRSHAYVFVAPGAATAGYGSSTTVQAGFGGEGVFWRGIGAGAELGGLMPVQSVYDSVGIFSANGYYHFVHGRDVKLDPFVTAGYSLLFRNGSANLFNYGGGVNWWFKRNLGLKLEFRDQVYPQPVLHYLGFRFGLNIRI